jgi:hypothetical protein
MKSKELKRLYPEIYRELIERGELEGVFSDKETDRLEAAAPPKKTKTEAVSLLVSMFSQIRAK